MPKRNKATANARFTLAQELHSQLLELANEHQVAKVLTPHKGVLN